MKNKQLSEKLVVKWLKKIFSIQTIAVVAGITAAWFTYKTYKDNKPAQISMEFYGFCESENVDEKVWFYNLISPDFSDGLIVRFGKDYPSAFFPSGIPGIANKSSKSIKDFRLDVTVSYTWFEFDQNDICPDFEIVENNIALHEIKLRYKYDVLNANSSIPNPIKWMHLMDTVPSPFEKQDAYAVDMMYTISYDGIPETRWFDTHFFVYYDDINPLDISDEYIDEFLTIFYKNGNFNRHNTMVAVIDKTRSKMAIPHGKLTDSKFEKFKKDFIKSRKK